jgi:hypothetical protein
VPVRGSFKAIILGRRTILTPTMPGGLICTTTAHVLDAISERTTKKAAGKVKLARLQHYTQQARDLFNSKRKRSREELSRGRPRRLQLAHTHTQIVVVPRQTILDVT